MIINGNLKTAFSNESLMNLAQLFPDDKITITPYADYETVHCNGKYICTVQTEEILENQFRALDMVIWLLS